MKSHKRLVLVALALVIALGAIPFFAAHANNPITVTVDGYPVNFHGQQPIIIHNRTFVPVRGVFERMGFVVSWFPETRTASLINSSMIILIPAGADFFTVNGVRHVPEVPQMIINNTMMLPLADIAESVGGFAGWDASRNMAVITTPGLGGPFIVDPQPTPIPPPVVTPIPQQPTPVPPTPLPSPTQTPIPQPYQTPWPVSTPIPQQTSAPWPTPYAPPVVTPIPWVTPFPPQQTAPPYSPAQRPPQHPTPTPQPDYIDYVPEPTPIPHPTPIPPHPTPIPQPSPVPTPTPIPSTPIPPPPTPQPTPTPRPTPIPTPPPPTPIPTPEPPTLPNRWITDAELTAWIIDYHERGGINEFELEVIRLTNIERVNYGLEPLVMSPTLMMASRFKSQGMRDLNYMAHTSPVYGVFTTISRVLFGFPVTAMGENLARFHRTPEEVVTAWMNSPGHRNNILNPAFTEIGTGHYRGHWTQKFATSNTAHIPAPTR